MYIGCGVKVIVSCVSGMTLDNVDVDLDFDRDSADVGTTEVRLLKDSRLTAWS